MTFKNQGSEKIAIKEMMLQNLNGNWFALVVTADDELLYSHIPKTIDPSARDFCLKEFVRNNPLVLADE